MFPIPQLLDHKEEFAIFLIPLIGVAGEHSGIIPEQAAKRHQQEKHTDAVVKQHRQHQREHRRCIQKAAELVHAVAACHHFSHGDARYDWVAVLALCQSSAFVSSRLIRPAQIGR